MPSVHEFALLYVHHVVQKSWILEVEIVVVLSNYDHVVSSAIIISIRSGIIERFEVLKQCYHGLPIFDEFLQLLQCHALITYKFQFVQKSMRLSKLFESVFKHDRSSSFTCNRSSCFHYFGFSRLQSQVIQNGLHGDGSTCVVSTLDDIWQINELYYPVRSVYRVSIRSSCEICIQELRQSWRNDIFCECDIEQCGCNQEKQESRFHSDYYIYWKSRYLIIIQIDSLFLKSSYQLLLMKNFGNINEIIDDSVLDFIQIELLSKQLGLELLILNK